MQALRARGHEATGTYSGHAVPDAWPLDIRNTEAVEHAVHFVKPDWIFCPAAISHVDYCEEHPDETFALNRDAPLFLGRMAQRAGAAFVFYSSDYVFDGLGGPFALGAPPRARGRALLFLLERLCVGRAGRAVRRGGRAPATERLREEQARGRARHPRRHPARARAPHQRGL